MIIAVLLVPNYKAVFLYTCNMYKSELREQYKQLRNRLSADQKKSYDNQLLAHLQQLDWNSCKYVHVFLSIASANEPDTSLFIAWMRVAHPSVNIVISKSDFSNGTMQNFLYERDTKLEVSKWGIPEPVHAVPVEEKKLDVILLPLLAVDKAGNRVGYGKGFYDRLLQQCRKNVYTVGLSYFEPVEHIEDIGEWDIPLKCCITPERIHYFQ